MTDQDQYDPNDSDKDFSHDKVTGVELGGPTPGASAYDGFNPLAYSLGLGPDGLPVEDDPPWEAKDAAPIPLTPETMACLQQPPGALTPKGLAGCSHYKRQRVHSPGAPDRAIIQRFCTHENLRGINGACLVLDDCGIFECEFRDPRDPRAEIVLDKIDHGKIAKGQVRLKAEKKTGQVHGYRMFRTAEDVALGRTVLDEDDVTTADTIKPTLDPLGPDDK